MKKTIRGFTLVELLIAIVVIAILASISVVAYNGIQQRAIASHAAATASSYIKMIKMYRAENGLYPAGGPSTAPSYGMACLGLPSDFPADGNFQAGECMVWAQQKASGYQPLVDELSAYGTVDNSLLGSYEISSTKSFRGVMHDPNSDLTMTAIQWVLRGDQRKNCGPAASSPYTTYDSYDNMTMCKILLE